MKLKVLLPARVLLDATATKVVAEAADGSRGLLPRHVDYVAALVPGILAYTSQDGEEHFVGVDEGVLVKRGDEVLVSVRRAVEGRDLGTIREQVEREFMDTGERDRAARSVMARLEAGFVKRFLEASGHG